MASSADDMALELAHRIVGLPLRRLRMFGLNAVNDVQWDMLLQLLIAEQEGRQLSVSVLQIGSGAPIEDARRYIRALVERRLIMVYDTAYSEAVALTAAARIRVVRTLVGEPRGEELHRPPQPADTAAG